MAYLEARKLLGKPAVISELERLKKLSGLTDEQVIEEATILAKSDITDFLEVKLADEKNPEKSGVYLRLKPSKDWCKNKRRAIQSIKQTKWGFEIKLHGKDVQLTNLFKHFKLFSEGAEEVLVSNLTDILQGRTMKDIWKDHEDKE